MPLITGLTLEQKIICDKIWACDSEQEVNDLIDSYEEPARGQARTLKALIVLECMDEHIVDWADCDQARNILDQIRT